jgi:8-oxo-dGTP pyrophosphatase MutT (NUDIX family)
VLSDELREELGLAPEAVEPPEPFALVLDASSGIAHVCLRVASRLDTAAVEARQRTLATDEYAEVRWVHRAALPDFLAAASSALLNPLPAMLVAAGLLDPKAAPAHS